MVGQGLSLREIHLGVTRIGIVLACQERTRKNLNYFHCSSKDRHPTKVLQCGMAVAKCSSSEKALSRATEIVLLLH